MATEEITISELELADEVLADMTLPVDTATETRAVTLKQLQAWLGSALPVGSVFASVGRLDDERFTLLDGKTISRIGTYEAFCNKVVEQVQAGNWFACSEEEYNADVSAYGQCGKFVVSNDYIRIPTITKFIGATITLADIGRTEAAGLPNITGDVTITQTHGLILDDGRSTPTGVFKVGTKSGLLSSSKDVTTNVGASLGVDASLSSSIYGNSDTVTPTNVKYPYYMVVSTEGQTAEVQIDINKVYEDLNLKANSNLSNVASVASSFKEASVGWGVPDYSAGISVAYPVQAKPFVAPSDGVYITTIVVNNTTAILYINGVATGYSHHNANSYRDTTSQYIPLLKGDSIYWSVATSTGTYTSMFYPFKGAN